MKGLNKLYGSYPPQMFVAPYAQYLNHMFLSDLPHWISCSTSQLNFIHFLSSSFIHVVKFTHVGIFSHLSTYKYVFFSLHKTIFLQIRNSVLLVRKRGTNIHFFLLKIVFWLLHNTMLIQVKETLSLQKLQW